MNKYLGLLFFLFLSGAVLGQEDDTLALKEARDQINLLYEQEEYEKALPYAETARDLSKQIYGETSNQYAESLDDLAFLYHDLGKLTKAEILYRKSFSIAKANREALEKLDTTGRQVTIDTIKNSQIAYSNASNNLALLCRDIGKYEEAEVLFMEALEIDKQIYGEKHPYILMGLNNLAILYQSTHQYIKVEQIYLEILDVCETNPARYYPYIAQVTNNLGVYYRRTRQYTKAIPLAKRSIEIYETYIGKDHGNYALGINNLALLYDYIEEYDLAGQKFKEAIRLQEQYLGISDFRLVHPLRHLAGVYVYKQKYKEAEQIFKRLEDIYIVNNREADISLMFVKQGWAKLYISKGELDIAYQYLDEAFYILSNKNYKLKDIVLDKVDVNNLFQKDDYIMPLLNTIHEWYLLKSKELDYSYESLKTVYDFVVFESLVSKVLLKKVPKKEDKLRLLSGMSKTFYHCIELAQQLYEKSKDSQYLKNALGFAEYNKSIVLSESLQSTEAFSFGGVPDSLTQKGKELQGQLDKLEKQKIKATNTKDSATLDQIRPQIIELNLQQDALLKHLKDTYPKYSKLRYEQKELDIDEVQKELLDNETALLEYFVYDTTAYLIVLTQKEIKLHPITFRKGELAKEIKTFRKSLSDYMFITGKPDKAYSLYTHSAHYFYEKLIAPAKLEGISKLIIVPDNLLSHIPFETLLLEESKNQDGNYANLEYLVKHYTISYSYSTELLLENKKTAQRENNGQLLAMGAVYNGLDSSVSASRSPLQTQLRKTLAPLPSIKQEIKKLETLYGAGQFLYGEAVNEATFKKIAGDYAIVHLAMHGLLNENHALLSSLAFSENGDTLEDNFLEAHEISNMQLNTDLVVLSACETGYGKFEQGEGVMSLARSFMYAGVPSLVVSLWQVNDKATAVLMENFYSNLYDGMSKNNALQQAKLDYIKNVKGIGAHPAFWSPFIQIGNTDAVNVAKGKTWLWWLGGLAGLALVVLAGRKWLKRSEYSLR
ncbi:MAG: CHAT domain-containing protein [Aureispira sp.]|nr:CHAT domain-containing protein [Aureispira sp.]